MLGCMVTIIHSLCVCKKKFIAEWRWRGHSPPFSYMKTYRGIYKNIKESDYHFTPVDYPHIRFTFSSPMYRNKFAYTYEVEILRFNQSINNVYKNKFNIHMDELALIRLYCLIEKRGFHIHFKGVVLTCPDDLVFVTIPTFKKNLDE